MPVRPCVSPKMSLSMPCFKIGDCKLKFCFNYGPIVFIFLFIIRIRHSFNVNFTCVIVRILSQNLLHTYIKYINFILIIDTDLVPPHPISILTVGHTSLSQWKVQTCTLANGITSVIIPSPTLLSIWIVGCIDLQP